MSVFKSSNLSGLKEPTIELVTIIVIHSIENLINRKTIKLIAVNQSGVLLKKYHNIPRIVIEACELAQTTSSPMEVILLLPTNIQNIEMKLAK